MKYLEASDTPAGYQFIFEPPSPERDNPRYGVRIDNRLLLRTFAIAKLGAQAAHGAACHTSALLCYLHSIDRLCCGAAINEPLTGTATIELFWPTIL